MDRTILDVMPYSSSVVHNFIGKSLFLDLGGKARGIKFRLAEDLID